MTGSTVQTNTGTYTGTTNFNVTLPTLSSGLNTVVLIIAGNTVVNTPAGWTLRASQVNQMGHYLFDRTGGASSWTFTASGSLTWFIAEIPAGVYGSSLSANDTTGNTVYTTPTLTPTAGTKVLLASIGSSSSPSAVRTVSGWTGGFTEIADLCEPAADFPMQGVASLEATPNGSTSYNTSVTYSATSPGRSAIIAAYSYTGAGTGSATVVAPAATAAVAVRAPFASGNGAATVVAVKATAAVTTEAPSVTVTTAFSGAGPLAATALVRPPTVTIGTAGSVTVVAVVARAINAQVRAPSVSTPVITASNGGSIGWWDGTSLQPLVYLGWWNGSSVN